MGVRRVAQQLRALGAQRQDAGDGGVGVVRVAVVAAADERAPDLLAQVAAGRVLEERLHRRARVEHRALGLDAARLRGGGQRRARRRGQAVEVALGVEDEPVFVLVGEQRLREPGVQARQLLVDRGQSRLGRGVQARAGAHEVGVQQPRQPLLLRVESRVATLGVDRVDAPVQPLVLDDPVRMRRQQWRDLALHRLHGGVVQRRGVDMEDRRRAAQRATAAFHGRDRVLEARRRGIGGDGVDLGQLRRHAREQRRLEVLDADPVERRDAAIAAGPRRQQRAGRRRGGAGGGGREDGSQGHGQADQQGQAAGRHVRLTQGCQGNPRIIPAAAIPR